MARSNEPVLWALFSSGGMLTAFLLPALVLVLWIAAPLGWVDVAATFESFARLAQHTIVRLGLVALIVLALFHWAHRFRYALYDGLQLYHLNRLIAVLTYGAATVVSLATVVTLLILF